MAKHPTPDVGDEWRYQQIIDNIKYYGAAETMRRSELAAGRKLHRPTHFGWLRDADWPDDIIVSQDGDEIRLVAIVAKRSGNGALTRLVERIQKRNWTPVVIAPNQLLRNILTRWGWERTDVGEGFDHEEQWRPSGRRLNAKSR